MKIRTGVNQAAMPLLRTSQHARARVRAFMALAALTAAALLAAVSAGAAPSRAATAHAAGTLSLSETGHLHLTSHHSFTLNEQGTTSGTISGLGLRAPSLRRLGHGCTLQTFHSVLPVGAALVAGVAAALGLMASANLTSARARARTRLRRPAHP